mgnify:FL=1
MFEKYPDILNFNQFRECLGIGKNKAYELLQQDEVLHFRIGLNYKIPKMSVINYVKNQLT